MTAALPEGVTIRWFDELDSTNSEVRRLAERGHSAGMWVAARRQTQGRGRRGRVWQSPEGNLMCTLLLRPGCTPAKAAQLSFVAGLAVHDTVCALMTDVPQSSIRLKWPNDLLVNGKKISGILLESATEGQGQVAWVAVGIGLNLVHFPEDTLYPATSLAQEMRGVQETACVPGVDETLEALAQFFDHWQRVWSQGQGFGNLYGAWMEKAAGLGQSITVRLATETLTGVFEGLNDEGALILRLNYGVSRVIPAGDVFFPDISD